MAQRLVRTIDKDSKEKYIPTSHELNRMNFSSKDAKSIDFYKGKPTNSNHNTGYKGRTAIHEVLEINSTIRQLIYEGANQNTIYDTAIKNGMTPLRDAGVDKIKSGVTTIEEILRATVEDN
jgi:type II secretory ATPase GspE/PulE/Tfp pilus assembly ATPase PilB-like protein